LTGAKPIFVDAEQITGNINIQGIETAINSKTKAIAVVHYLGVPVNMPEVVQIAKKHNLFLIEDCALAPGAKIDDIHVRASWRCWNFFFLSCKTFNYS
jgi:dTDP-4-amino-4,6-dideoxygalactose transaminase